MPHRSPVPVIPIATDAPLDLLGVAFRRVLSGRPPVTVDGAAVAGLPARALRLDEVRDQLADRRCPTATRDAAWAYLIGRARAEAGVWTVACLGIALPGLTATSHRLCRDLSHDT